MIDIAKQVGADAVKFQTWLTEEIITKDTPKADYQKKLTGASESQFSMLKKLELSFDDFRELKLYSDKKDIIFLSTPGDNKSADALDTMGVLAFKIGSDDLTNLPFLEYVACKMKPMIVSTGMAYMQEVADAVATIKDTGNENISILHCTD